MSFTDRTRRRFLIASVACFAVVLVMLVLGRNAVARLDDVDAYLNLGPAWWRGDSPWVEDPLVFVARAFGTLAKTLATIAVAAVLLVRKQPRAAAYVVIVMSVSSDPTLAPKNLHSDSPRERVHASKAAVSSAQAPEEEGRSASRSPSACHALTSCPTTSTFARAASACSCVSPLNGGSGAASPRPTVPSSSSTDTSTFRASSCAPPGSMRSTAP